MTRNDEIVEDPYMKEYLNAMKIFECSSFFVMVCLVSIYIRILLRRQFCNNNLLLLLILQPSFHILNLFTRVVKHSITWMGLMNEEILEMDNMLADIFVTASFQIVLGYAIERFIAMKYVFDYDERFRTVKLAICIAGGSCVYSVVLIYMWSKYYISNELTYTCQYLLFGSAGLIFIVLRWYSREAYEKVARRHNATVSERFKTARNLKAATLLIYLAPYKCLTNFASLYAYHWIWEEHEPFYFDFYGVFYYLSGHVQILGQMLLTVSGHSCLSEEFLKMFGIERKETQEIRTVTGQKMIFTKEEEPDLYLKQLAASWNAVHYQKTSTKRSMSSTAAKYTASVSPTT